MEEQESTKRAPSLEQSPGGSPRQFPPEGAGGWASFWSFAGPTLTVGVLLLIVYRIVRLPDPVAPTPSPTPSTVAEAARSAVTEAGRSMLESKKGRQWLMEASKVKWSDVGKKAHVDAVDWTLKTPKGKNVVTVKAPGAEVFVDDSRVQFQGMVDTFRFATGDHVWGRDLIWDGKKSLLSGDHGVRWVRGKTVVTADHMTASDHLEHIHLEGNVKITTLINQGPPAGRAGNGTNPL